MSSKLDNEITQINQTKPKSVGGVQSLEIGLSILDILINQNEPMMLKDIAQAMQMHPAKAHRYLVSLIRKEFAAQTSDGRYEVGQRANALAHSTVNQNNVLQRLIQAASAIKDTVNCSVQIAKWFNEGPIIIQSIESDSAVSIITRIGSRMPIGSSATGRLFASFRPEDDVKLLLQQEWEHAHLATEPKNSVAYDGNVCIEDIKNIEDIKDVEGIMFDWDSFSQQKHKVLEQGYSSVEGDMLAGINAISIPFFECSHPLNTQISTQSDISNQNLEYAITVIGTAKQLPLDDDSEVIATIIAICQRHQNRAHYSNQSEPKYY